MAGREEQKRRDWHVERAVTAAKRNLAIKVLAVIDGERSHDNLDNEGDIGYMRAIRDVTEALCQLFASEHIEVERSGDGD